MTPVQSFTWLEFDLDLSQGIVLVPTSKIEDHKKQQRSLQNQCSVPDKQIASVVGKIISMSTALGPVARLITRGLYSLLNSHNSWFETLCTMPEAVKGTSVLVYMKALQLIEDRTFG